MKNNLRRNSLEEKIIITVNNSYSQIDSDLPKHLVDELDKRCSFYVQGYQYSDLFKRGIWDGKKHLFNTKTYAFQTGLVSLIVSVINNFGGETSFRDMRVKPVKKYNIEFSGFELRDYQIDAVAEAIKCGRGVLNMSTGSGKTAVMSKIVQEIGVKTLILVNTKEALFDTLRTLERCFDKEYYTCYNDKKQVNKFITVTTMSMAISEMKSKKVDSLLSHKFDCLVLDESHHSAAKSWQSVALKIAAYHIFGFTGTNFRGDGADLLLQGVSGRAIYKLGAKELQKQGYLSQADIFFVNILFPEIRANYSDYWELYRIGIITNDYRNGIIQKIVKKHIGKSILVVIEKIEHGEIILELLKEIDPDAVFVHGKTKDRDILKNKFESGEIRTIIASLPSWELVLIRKNNEIKLMPIKSVYESFSEGMETLAYSFPESKVVWARVNNVYRHTTDNLKVVKTTGVSNFDCFVTNNHSLLSGSGEYFTPSVGKDFVTPFDGFDFNGSKEYIDMIDVLISFNDDKIFVSVDGLSQKDMLRLNNDYKYITTDYTFGDKRTEKAFLDRMSDPGYERLVRILHKVSYNGCDKYVASLVSFDNKDDILFLDKYYPCKLYHTRSRNTIFLPLRIRIDKYLCRLLGFFMGDGCYNNYSKNGITQYLVFFSSKENKDYKANTTISDDKRCLIREMLDKVFEGNGFYTNSTGIGSRNRIIYYFFEYLVFYTKAREKRVPDIIYNLDISLRKEFLFGYFLSDGHYRKDMAEINYTTTSREVCIGVYYLLRSVGVKKITYSYQRAGAREINKRIYDCKHRYTIRVFESLFGLDIKNKNQKGRAYYFKNGSQPIKSVETMEYTDNFVYDLEVDSYQNFLSGIGVVAHNSRIYNESADLPILNVVVNCSGGKSGIAVIQRIGRALRTHHSKDRAIIYDFNDIFSAKLEKHSDERVKVIKKEGHKIVEINPEDI